MEKKTPPKRKPDPVKMQALRSLPLEVKQQLTREEADAFLYEDVWPDSLYEKPTGYLVDNEGGDSFYLDKVRCRFVFLTQKRLKAPSPRARINRHAGGLLGEGEAPSPIFGKDETTRFPTTHL